MAMSDKDFKEIEAAVDRLFDSDLTAQQREDATTMMRVAYRHIHKANNLIYESQLQSEKAITQSNRVLDNHERLEFSLMPVTTMLQ